MRSISDKDDTISHYISKFKEKDGVYDVHHSSNRIIVEVTDMTYDVHTIPKKVEDIRVKIKEIDTLFPRMKKESHA